MVDTGKAVTRRAIVAVLIMALCAFLAASCKGKVDIVRIGSQISRWQQNETGEDRTATASVYLGYLDRNENASAFRKPEAYYDKLKTELDALDFSILEIYGLIYRDLNEAEAIALLDFLAGYSDKISVLRCGAVVIPPGAVSCLNRLSNLRELEILVNAETDYSGLAGMPSVEKLYINYQGDHSAETFDVSRMGVMSFPNLAAVSFVGVSEQLFMNVISELSSVGCLFYLGNEPVTPGDFLSLISAGAISAIVSGSSIEQTNVRLESLSSNRLLITIPLGVFFIASSGSVQNMVVRTPKLFLLSAGATMNINVLTACMNIDRSIPGSGDGFAAGMLDNRRESRLLEHVVRVCDERGASYAVTQAAVWIVTDNPDDRTLTGTLRSGGYGHGIGGVFVISSDDVAEARDIVAEAGRRLG